MTFRPPAHKRLFFISLLLAAFSLTIDQLSKEWLLAHLSSGQREIMVTPFFNLVMVWNYGVSFGMLAEHRQPLILIIISSIILLILLVWLYKNTYKTIAAGLGLVMGGAVGNIIDRVRFGAVADFFDFHVAGYHWPAFNIADSCIFIGVVLLCVHSMFMETNDRKLPNRKLKDMD